jgi:hypothetical protein
MNNILKLKITTKKSALESVRQIIRQKPAKASGVRQRLHVLFYCYKSFKVPEGSTQCLQGPTPKEEKIPTSPPSGGGRATSSVG